MMNDKKYEDGLYLDMSDAEYRRISRNHQSGIKTYLDSREKYFKEYILGDKEPLTWSTGLIIGSLADNIMSYGENSPQFNESFTEEGGAKPTGQFGDLVDEVIRGINANIQEGELKEEMSNILQVAFNKRAYDYNGKRISLRKGSKQLSFLECIQALEENGGMDYIKKYITSLGKMLYGPLHLKSANNIISILRTHRNTECIFGGAECWEGEMEVFNQMTILFTYRGIKFKVRLDKVLVDHEKGLIKPLDLKCTYNSALWHSQQFYKFKYWLQAALYTMALENLLEGEWQEYADKGYKISWGEEYNDVPFLFTVCSYGKNGDDPLLYGFNKDNIRMAREGYITQWGNYQGGIDYFCECLLWHEQTSNWKTDPYLFAHKGFSEISPLGNKF